MINELITQGYEAKKKCESNAGKLGIIISGEEYATWLMTCSQVLLKKFPDNELTKISLVEQKMQMGIMIKFLMI